MSMKMGEPYAVSVPPSRSSSRSWVTTRCQSPSCQSSFITRDKFLNGSTVASISCSKQTNETEFMHNEFILCEEDFISKSKASATTVDGRWSFAMHQSQNSLRSRTNVSSFMLSYVAVILLLLMLFTNVSPSFVSYDDLCLNVTWSGSTRCNCSMHSLNVSSCRNYSRFDELRYSCSCGGNMVCDISVLNSTDSEPLLGNCSCINGSTGHDCVTPMMLADDDLCANVSCLNGSTCIPDSLNSSYPCDCHIELHCGAYANECNVTDYCQNNGTCLNVNGSYSCSCLPGYTGGRCETDVNECSPAICQHHGNCSNVNGSYECTCSPGYSGANCSDRDACFVNPCQNNGTCLNGTNTYNCSCAHGFMGFNCSEIDPCASSSCKNGTCHNMNNGSYECLCPPGLTGENCSEIDHCASKPCVHGTCGNVNDTYNCSCSDGFIGVNCSIQPCAEQPCKNNGQCLPQLSAGNCSSADPCYVCDCPVNYTGMYCETLIGGSSPSSGDSNNATVALIAGLTIGLFVILVIIVALILAIIVRNKRRNLGTYHPSRQEVVNARLEINGGLKPPPEERLI